MLLSLVHTQHAALICDAPSAVVAGVKPRVVEAVAFFALVVVTVIGVKVVGVVLMVAVVIAPAAAARQFTRRLPSFIVVSAVFGALAAAVGCYVSIAFGPLPTGPAIALAQAALVTCALLWRRKKA